MGYWLLRLGNQLCLVGHRGVPNCALRRVCPPAEGRFCCCQGAFFAGVPRYDFAFWMTDDR